MSKTCLATLHRGTTTIEVLWRVLNDIQTEEGQLPGVLLLQLDNTTKQNKGRFLFAFLALLVHHNVFDKVLVSFLPVVWTAGKQLLTSRPGTRT